MHALGVDFHVGGLETLQAAQGIRQSVFFLRARMLEALGGSFASALTMMMTATSYTLFQLLNAACKQARRAKTNILRVLSHHDNVADAAKRPPNAWYAYVLSQDERSRRFLRRCLGIPVVVRVRIRNIRVASKAEEHHILPIFCKMAHRAVVLMVHILQVHLVSASQQLGRFFVWWRLGGPGDDP